MAIRLSGCQKRLDFITDKNRGVNTKLEASGKKVDHYLFWIQTKRYAKADGQEPSEDERFGRCKRLHDSSPVEAKSRKIRHAF